MNEYSHSQAGYTIEYPSGWNIDQETVGVVVIASPDGASYIEILSEPIPREWSLGELTDNYRQRVARRAANWELYREISVSGEFRGATNYIHLEFRRQEDPGDCVENGVTHLYRSRFFPAKLQSFAVTMSICEDSLRRYGPLRETTILTGFEEFQTQ